MKRPNFPRTCRVCKITKSYRFSHYAVRPGRKQTRICVDDNDGAWYGHMCYDCMLADNRGRRRRGPRPLKFTPEVIAYIEANYRVTAYHKSNVEELAAQFGVHRRSITNLLRDRRLQRGESRFAWTRRRNFEGVTDKRKGRSKLDRVVRAGGIREFSTRSKQHERKNESAVFLPKGEVR